MTWEKLVPDIKKSSGDFGSPLPANRGLPDPGFDDPGFSGELGAARAGIVGKPQSRWDRRPHAPPGTARPQRQATRRISPYARDQSRGLLHASSSARRGASRERKRSWPFAVSMPAGIWTPSGNSGPISWLPAMMPYPWLLDRRVLSCAQLFCSAPFLIDILRVVCSHRTKSIMIVPTVL
jgi:hypothetical protein